jgi:hypothetical protein
VYPEWIVITYVNRHWRAVALNHRSLWGSVTPNLSPEWLKVLIMRSEPAPVDAELRVGQVTVKRICLCIDEVIRALAGCTRLCSLRLVGPRRDVGAVLDALRTPTPLRSLTISLWEPGPPVMLPEVCLVEKRPSATFTSPRTAASLLPPISCAVSLTSHQASRYRSHISSMPFARCRHSHISRYNTAALNGG